jgi:hypothetical protein
MIDTPSGRTDLEIQENGGGREIFEDAINEVLPIVVVPNTSALILGIKVELL